MIIDFVKTEDYIYNLIFMAVIIIPVILGDFLFYIIITLTNNYKKKQFIQIKNNGIYFEGVIIMATHHSKGYGNHKWLWKNSGDISVIVDNKIYTITDIDYNNEFKLLKQKLNDDFDTNSKQYDNLNQSIKNNSIVTFSKVHRKEIKVGIYVLDNKAVADFDSIKFI